MTAVDRANLDLVLPQIAAQHIFVRPAERGSDLGGSGHRRGVWTRGQPET